MDHNYWFPYSQVNQNSESALITFSTSFALVSPWKRITSYQTKPKKHHSTLESFTAARTPQTGENHEVVTASSPSVHFFSHYPPLPWFFSLSYYFYQMTLHFPEHSLKLMSLTFYNALPNLLDTWDLGRILFLLLDRLFCLSSIVMSNILNFVPFGESISSPLCQLLISMRYSLSRRTWSRVLTQSRSGRVWRYCLL